MSNNPLLINHNLPFDAIAFNKLTEEDFLPALKETVEKAEQEIEHYVQQTDLSFKSVIEDLDALSEDMDHVANVFYGLYNAHATEKLRSYGSEFSKTLTNFSNKITLDERIFTRIKSLYDKKEELSLTPEQSQILTKSYDDFVRNGALLPEDKKEQLKKINEELADLSVKFADTLLDSKNELFLQVENEVDLDGVPSNVKEEALERAKSKDLSGWVFNLDYPSYLPFMKFAKNRKLRKKFFEINNQAAFNEKFNNTDNVYRTVELRIQRAQLLGYKTHAQYVLEKRMAETPERVQSFQNELKEKALSAAKKDIQKLKDLAKEIDGVEDFERWDLNYYIEILKKRELNFDDEVLRPYLSQEKVMEGVFTVANKLYGLKFTKQSNLPIYHEDVQVYQVTQEETGDHIGLFYVDLYPRETKKGGAWMMNYADQGLYKGSVRRPLVGIVCNFTKPTKTQPSLLNLNEVLTLFHEFGHALHGLLSNCHYRTLSGTSVYWDFVELPSQIMENWVKEKECLDLFAEHFETGEKIPEDIVDKIIMSNQFMEGYMTIRQLSFGWLDMCWHNLESMPEGKDIIAFENEALKDFALFEMPRTSARSVTFGHLFAGGYSAGYYSYKWAEVLDADAFEFFKEKGIFNKDVAKSFRENILERGGTKPPLELFKAFRGREPDVKALLNRAGLN